MARLLIVTDSTELEAQLASVLESGGDTIYAASSGRAVLEAVRDLEPQLVILDAQIGSMGGIAISTDLRLEAGAGRAPDTKILLLLDRRADVFTARRTGADGYLVKPLNALLLRKAVAEVLAGNLFLDNSYRPLDSGATVATATP